MWRAHIDGDIPYLLATLGDPDPDVRALAAEYLGKSQDQRAVRPLLPLLRAANPHVRARAARALGVLGAVASVSELADLARSDPIVWVRQWALDAVVRIPESDAVAVLTDALRDPSRRVRILAVAHLVDQHATRALDELRSAMASEPWFRRRPYRRAIYTLQKQR